MSNNRYSFSNCTWNLLLLLGLLLFREDAGATFTELNSPFKSKIIKIKQDSIGFIWFATESSIERYDGYQFEPLSLDEINNDTSILITDFVITDKDVMYIATANKGLFKYATKSQNKPTQTSLITDKTIYAIIHDKQSLWVATDKALYQLIDNKVNEYKYPTNKLLISNMLKIGENNLIFSSINTLYNFNTSDLTFNEINLDDQNNDSYIWGLTESINSGLLVSTDNGLYHGNSDLKNWQPLVKEKLNHRIRTMAVHENQVWLGSLKNGLQTYKSQPDKLVDNYQSFDSNNSDLQNNEIYHLFFDRDGNLWVGLYNGKITLLSQQSLAFGHNKGLQTNSNCMLSAKHTYDINQDKQQNIWLTTLSGLIKINTQNNHCTLVEIPLINGQNQTTTPLFTFLTDDGYLWAYSYRLGFTKFSQELQPRVIETLDLTREDLAIYELIKQNGPIWVLATSSGVMAYDTTQQKLSAIKVTDKKIDGAIIFEAFEKTSNQFYLATSRGMALYDSINQQVSPLSEVNEALASQALNTLHIDTQNNLWVGTSDSGLYKFDQKLKLVKNYNEDSTIQSYKNISNIMEDNHQNLWFTTEDGLIKLSTETGRMNLFNSTDGLQGDIFNIGAAFKSNTGEIYLGGINGINVFIPDNITNQTSSNVAISELKRFNQPIKPKENYDGFQINQAISYLNDLTLSHNDYVISFNFTDFNFSNPEKSQFAYQLNGFDPDWNYVSSNNRTATYTNLPSGEFVFNIKSSNQAGVWSQENQSLVINVKPPPWLTWWALTSYVLMLLAIIFWYIQRKIRVNKKIADMLRVEVKEKTKELSIQKQTVESLLAKKNELFSNVSHEFRTPLTLILGPIKELLDKHVDTDDVKSLSMVNRNANRLLSLVEQLLQIARVSDFTKVKTTPQNAQLQIQSLVESFQHMAQVKNLDLELTQNEPATIKVTDQFIDAVMGNLISNAIKYTQVGGSVTVKTEVTDGTLLMSVKDTGAGLTKEQQQDIFKRFKRLESHQAIEGIGIGLSVVEEVVKINDGAVKVESEIGVGSVFSVWVPLSDATDIDQTESISTLVNQLQAESLEVTAATATEDSGVEDGGLNTVLVIEDNHDMREHIIEIVRPHYNILAAENGVKGVAKAIDQIPDIIISDVMMPEMDGYNVARIIRADQRTSHIPLMLLTALNDKTSRIKGWREHVDAYMTKPFDRDELLVQVENMLTIRDILKRKAGQSISKPQNNDPILPKKDQDFVDKLIAVIEKNYQNPILNRDKIASAMAVSDRQLQRKIKALIDQNPMDLLREFRLNKAKEKLKEGYQVSQISDECGFNSLSYFSQCFKAKFGMSPKKFQQSK